MLVYHSFPNPSTRLPRSVETRGGEGATENVKLFFFFSHRMYKVLILNRMKILRNAHVVSTVRRHDCVAHQSYRCSVVGTPGVPTIPRPPFELFLAKGCIQSTVAKKGANTKRA